jgi:hypothetical protein
VAQPVASSTTAQAFFLLPTPTNSLLFPASKKYQTMSFDQTRLHIVCYLLLLLTLYVSFV